MPSNSEQERERLKEEYKEHFRKIRDTKEKLRRSKYVKNISDAVEQMNADDLLDTVDEFLGKVRNRMVHLESRLDVAMEQFTESQNEEKEAFEEELKKEKARDTLKSIKLEMGLLYTEIEKQADELKVEKTVGKKEDREFNNSDEDNTSNLNKDD